MTSALSVSEATAVTDDLVAAMGRLVPQLSRTVPPPTAGQLVETVAAPATILLVARLASDGEAGGAGDIVGTLTLVVFRIPTGVRAMIEDVVVDDAARGRGVGEALTYAAIDRARAAGARTVDLTSRPARVAANRLYQRLGFEQRETNIYRFTLD